MARVTWRGVVTDEQTAAALAEVARISGPIYVDPIQGSYTSANPNSAGTHDGGGVVDLNAERLTNAQARDLETACRRVGFAAWFRPDLYRADGSRVWQRHVHAVRVDCSDLAADARTQVADYRAGYNGLPIGNRTNRDTGSRAYVGMTWTTYRQQQEDEVTPEDRKAIAADVAALIGPMTWRHDLTNRGATVDAGAWLVGASGKLDDIKATLKAMADPAPLAAAIAPLLPAGTVVTVDVMAAALREVLGSLDSASAVQ